MKLASTIEKRSQEYSILKERSGFACRFSVLVVEDDYVSYLFLKEVLATLKMRVLRATTLNQALMQKQLQERIDLLIVNNSLTCAAQISDFEYLREVYSVPVVIVGGGEKDNVRFQEVVDWADGIISLNTDSENISETISDMLGIKLSMPVFT